MTSRSDAASAPPALDLFSITQTNPRCGFGSPLVAVLKDGYGTIQQACCNHWECPRCGQIRAREEYRRIVNGAEVLAEDHKLYFWTLTCRGKECSLSEAEENYYAWTNVLFTNARTKAKRGGLYWAYSQVTERQHKTRQHPHSHIITSYLPEDAVQTALLGGALGYVSQWFDRANLSAGLGSQHRISEVKNAAAVARYIAKYMFKTSMTETWPNHWRRVRYSQNWPKLPHWTPDFATVLSTPSNWLAAEREKTTWVCETLVDYERARRRIANIQRGDVALMDSIERDKRIMVTALA